MTRIPNMSQPGAGEAAAEAPKADPAGVQTISDGPAPAAPPPSSQEPPQLPFIHSQADGTQQEGAFLTDDQFMHDFLKEDHTVPATVLIVSVVLSFLYWGYQGLVGSDAGFGAAGAFGACVIGALLIGVTCLTSTAAGWIICKIFGEDYGSAGSLFLRFSAVAAAQFPVFALLDALIGGLLAFLFAFPVVLVLAMVIAGFDILRAFLYCVILNVVNWMLVIFLLASVATAFAA